MMSLQVWELGAGHCLGSLNYLPCDFFILPHTLSFFSILTQALSYLIVGFKDEKKKSCKSSRGPDPEIIYHSFCHILLVEASHRVNRFKDGGNGLYLLMKDWYACTGLGGIFCGLLADRLLYSALLFKLFSLMKPGPFSQIIFLL